MWYYVELFWYFDFGFNMYVNNILVVYFFFINVVFNIRKFGVCVLVGWVNDGDMGEIICIVMMIVDEMEVWYGWREGLVVFDYIFRGRLWNDVVD